jgi:hypothetical protein
VLLFIAVLGLISVAVVVYFTLMGIVGMRARRVKSMEELEEQSQFPR